MKLIIKKLQPEAQIPKRQTASSAGYDLVTVEDRVLLPGNRHAFSTGLSTAIPIGCYGRIAPRSGLAFWQGLDVMAGVIDADFRNEVKVILINLGSEPVEIKKGDRIAQLIIEQCRLLPVEETEQLPEPEQCEGYDTRVGGFGSTGISDRSNPAQSATTEVDDVPSSVSMSPVPPAPPTYSHALSKDQENSHWVNRC